ncbi:response regulator [Escherichia coli]|uniref:response regulator n=1 Tax=Escherichia coli TaxID=562 RepID=UPI00035E1556|nr:response regulator [Escherichia coli]
MKILIVEDDTLLLQGLILAAQTEGYACDGVTTARMAEQSLEAGHYSLVVLDLGLPDEDGLHFLARIRQKKYTLPVLILTARDTLTDKIAGLDVGADDYLVKPFAFAELLARVRTLLRRGAAVIIESQFQVADLMVDLVSRKVTRSGTRITLTSKEFTLLEFFLRHQGEVLPRSLIASQVWDMNFDSDTNAIDVAVKRLRGKIDNDFEPKLIQTVRGVGYMLEVPDGQ